MTKEQMMLYKILESRELRYEKQKSLMKKFDCCLVSFTLNIPGGYKDSPVYRKAHEEGLRILTKSINDNNLNVLYKESIHKDTGSEAYISIEADPYIVKALTVAIEEDTPLGRIYDFDVIHKSHNIISRKELGFKERRCFVCQGAANICRKNKAHSIDELTNYINKLVYDYFNLNQ
jgi:holo-ACP synthase